MEYDILMPCFPILDVIIPMEDTFPICAGESKIVHRVEDEAGGPANTFFAAARMGAKILPVGVVGDDDHGRFLLRTYQEEGIDVSCIQMRHGYATPQALCINDLHGRHAFITMVHGEVPVDSDTLWRQMENSRSLALTGYLLASPNAEKIAMNLLTYAREHKKDVFFDPGPLIPQIKPALLEQVLASTTVLIVNDEEAALLSGAGTVEAAAEQLHGKTGGTVVVKAGPKGCYIWHAGQGCWYPGFSVPLVDTTGAGDSFMGAFMHGWLSGWDIGTVATVANAAGAVKTSKPGSGRQVPTYREVVDLLRASGYDVPAVNDEAGKFISLALMQQSC